MSTAFRLHSSALKEKRPLVGGFLREQVDHPVVQIGAVFDHRRLVFEAGVVHQIIKAQGLQGQVQFREATAKIPAAATFAVAVSPMPGGGKRGVSPG